MIVTHIRIQNVHQLGTLVHYDFRLDAAAGNNGYQLKAIDGFGPSPTGPFLVGFSTASTAVIQNAPKDKQLTMKVGFVPGASGTVSTLRDALYKLIGRPVRVSLMSDLTEVAYIVGNIRNFDPTHSSAVPEVVLNVYCEDGEFVSPTSVNVSTAGLSKVGFSIVVDQGTAPTGMYLQVTFTASMSNFGLWQAIGLDSALFNVAYPFQVNDIFEVSTWRKTRQVVLRRGGGVQDITPYVVAGSVWPLLHTGENVFATTNQLFNWGAIIYVPRYWGI